MKKSIKTYLAVAGSVITLTSGALLFSSSGATAAAGDYYVRDSGNTAVGSGGDSGIVTVECDTGDKATGGGVGLNWVSQSDFSDVVVQESYPLYSSGVAYGWVGAVHNGEPASRNMRVWVICDDTA